MIIRAVTVFFVEVHSSKSTLTPAFSYKRLFSGTEGRPLRVNIPDRVAPEMLNPGDNRKARSYRYFYLTGECSIALS
jgi:hypothetical protein